MEGKKFDWKDKKIIIITCSLFLNLIFGSAAYTYYGQLTELRDVEQRNETLIAENTGLQQTNEDLQEENEDLQIQIDDLQPKVDALNSQVQTLTTEKTNLQNQVSSLTDSNKSLQSQIDNLKKSGSSSSGSSSSGGSSSGSSSGPLTNASASTQQSRTVYITDTGSKYHRAGCRYLKKSQHAISLSEAKRLGYTACSVCGG